MAIPHRSGGKRRAATNAARRGIAALQQGAAEEALAHLARAIAGAARDALPAPVDSMASDERLEAANISAIQSSTGPHRSAPVMNLARTVTVGGPWH